MASSLVAVTGATGFIASHIVKQLLEQGYRVRATVRDKSNKAKVQHLKNLPNASSNLELFEADLLGKTGFYEAFKGVEGVFHTATPVLFGKDVNLEEAVYKPALEGLQNVLDAISKTPSIKTFVLTSSMAAVAPKEPVDVKSERLWSDSVEQKSRGNWYGAAKTDQEHMAEGFFAQHKDCRYVAICPTMVLGPMLQPNINGTMQRFKELIQGSMKKAPNDSMSFVDVRDCAALHIAAYKNPSASGRYMCVVKSYHWNDILQMINKVCGANLQFEVCDGAPVASTKFDLTKMNSLGVKFRDVETIFREAYEDLKKKELL